MLAESIATCLTQTRHNKSTNLNSRSSWLRDQRGIVPASGRRRSVVTSGDDLHFCQCTCAVQEKERKSFEPSMRGAILIQGSPIGASILETLLSGQWIRHIFAYAELSHELPRFERAGHLKDGEALNSRVLAYQHREETGYGLPKSNGGAAFPQWRSRQTG